ncbi:MAG: hypothetical protein ACM3NQ_20225, partial [Bacteroidales bacterium]
PTWTRFLLDSDPLALHFLLEALRRHLHHILNVLSTKGLAISASSVSQAWSLQAPSERPSGVRELAVAGDGKQPEMDSCPANRVEARQTTRFTYSTEVFRD